VRLGARSRATIRWLGVEVGDQGLDQKPAIMAILLPLVSIAAQVICGGFAGVPALVCTGESFRACPQGCKGASALSPGDRESLDGSSLEAAMATRRHIGLDPTLIGPPPKCVRIDP
jgi:hypothetical protein